MVNLDINVSLMKFRYSLKQYLLSNVLLLCQLQLTQWTEKINFPVAVRGEMFGGNKLRTYKLLKMSSLPSYT